LESRLRYPTKEDIFTSRLKEDDVKEDLQCVSLSDLIKRIKEEGIGRVAPKHLWLIYDKVEKLKKQEKKEIVEERIKKCIGIIKKIQSEKEDKQKKKKELREKLKKKEAEASIIRKELDKYEREDHFDLLPNKNLFFFRVLYIIVFFFPFNFTF